MSSPSYEAGRRVIALERDALTGLLADFETQREAFERAVALILACPGRIILCGIGKSGQIGRKIAATLVSTGTPASFLHPAEGFHGDVGIVTSRDVVVAISNSGTTREVMELVPTIRNLGAKVIALTGPSHSPLAKAADVALCWGEIREADAMGLVPTVSAALTLAIGDALTVAVMERRGFGASDYRLFHPSGAIGTKLTLRVIDLLRGPHTHPHMRDGGTFAEAIEVLTRHTLGGVSVVDAQGRLVGLLTDGDVRRTIQVAKGDVATLLGRPIGEVMTRSPVTVRPEALAIDALRVMEGHQPRPINLVPVVDEHGRAVGMLHVHTLVQAGLTGERG